MQKKTYLKTLALYRKESPLHPQRTYHVQHSHCVGGGDEDGDPGGVVDEQGGDFPNPSRDAHHARTYTFSKFATSSLTFCHVQSSVLITTTLYTRCPL